MRPPTCRASDVIAVLLRAIWNLLCKRRKEEEGEMLVSEEKVDSKLKLWIQRELSKLLNFPVEEELVSYLLSIESAKDAEEYLAELLGPKGTGFVTEFLSRRHGEPKISSLLGPMEGSVLERLPHDELVLFRGEVTTGAGGGGGGRGAAKSGRNRNPRKKDTSGAPPGFSRSKATPTSISPWNTKTSPPTNLHEDAPPLPKPGIPSSTSPLSSSTVKPRPPATSKKRKFVPMLSSEGQSRAAMQLPGRHVCQCLAQKHQLVNNCVECGRIVCSQEGAGPCVFCGSLVFPPEEEKMLAKDSKRAQKIKEQLIKQYKLQEGERAFEHFKTEESSVGLEKAVKHKDKLIDFDQTSAQRTHVLDDEGDFFSVDATSWTTPEEKTALQKREEELREKKFGSRRNKTVTLDITGRKVLEDKTEFDIYDEANVRDLKEKMKKKETRQAMADISNPSIPIERPKFRFLEGEEGGRGRGRVRGVGEGGRGGEGSKVTQVTRLQDRELQEMRDEGKCLSMHQPWASLLVEGIKQVEGRSWYTTHRGRLWIAAAAKVPTQTEIGPVENLYRRLYEGEVMFPTDYPTGCLLGYVDVSDCLSQEEYREQYPEGESESPYVFICHNPHSLPVKFPIKGSHKIWSLPRDIHSSAKALSRPATLLH